MEGFMKSKKSFLFAGAVLAGMTFCYVPAAFAADVNMPVTAVLHSSIDQQATQSLDFGSIDLSPVASTITLNASSGSGTPTASGSTIISGGNEGIISVWAAMNMTITLTYPNDNVVELTNMGDTVYVNNIAANSQNSGGTVGHTGHASTPTTIAIGGTVDFTGNEGDGTYSGVMPIVLAYN